MTQEYAADERTIILAVSPATNDINNSDSIQIAKEVDKKMDRTIGVITKIDIIQDEDSKNQIKKILQNEILELKYGYIGFKGRSSDDIRKGVTIEKSKDSEIKYFRTTNPYK